MRSLHKISPGYIESRVDGKWVLPWERKREFANEVRRQLRGVKYDTIVGTGMSGAMVVPWLAGMLHKNFALVRRDRNESTHSSVPYVGTVGERWVFVDDLVSTGKTSNHVKSMVKIGLLWDPYDDVSTYVGTYTYSDHTFHPS